MIAALAEDGAPDPPVPAECDDRCDRCGRDSGRIRARDGSGRRRLGAHLQLFAELCADREAQTLVGLLRFGERLQVAFELRQSSWGYLRRSCSRIRCMRTRTVPGSAPTIAPISSNARPAP